LKFHSCFSFLALGLVSDDQYEAHKEAKKLKHEWNFNGEYGNPRGGKFPNITSFKCRICGKQEERNEKGRVIRR